MISVPKPSEARGTTGAAPVAALCALSVCAGGAYAVDAAREAITGHHVVPIPHIVQKPSSRTDVRWALFTFSDKEPGVRFKCSLDNSKFVPCSSRALYGLIEEKVKSRGAKRSRGRSRPSGERSLLKGAGKLLELGGHTFRVKAKSKTGRESRLAVYAWTVLTRAQLEAGQHSPLGTGSSSSSGSAQSSGSGSTIAGSGGSGSGGTSGSGGGSTGSGGGSTPIARPKGFIISGTPEGALYPGGPALNIPLALFNPNPVPIYVTGLTVTVASSPEGCPAEENVRVTQSDASAEKPITVPANTAVTLPAQGVSAPSLQLLNLPVNQNACQNATFPLTYSGSAHS